MGEVTQPVTFPSFYGSVPLPGTIAVITGDSIGAGGNYNVTCAGSAVSCQNNTIAINASNHGLFRGQPVFLGGAVDNRINGFTTVASYVDANNFTVTSPFNFGSTPVTDTAPTITISNPYRYTSRNMLAIANANNGWPIDRIYNCCANGTTTAYHLSRFVPDVLALQPHLVMYCGAGTNDIRAMTDSAGAIAATVTTITGRINSMASQAVASGAIFILCTMPPYDSGSANYTVNRLAAYNRVQNWSRQYASKKKGVLLCDFQALMGNSASATGNYLTSPASYCLTDKIHPADFGAYRGAVNVSPANQDLSSVLASIFPTQKRYDVISQYDDFNVTTSSKQYNYNPLMQGSGGTVSGAGSSGTCPDTLQVTNGGGAVTVWSVAARADGLGNDAVATINGAGTGQLNFIGIDTFAQVAAGDVWQLSGDIQGSTMGGQITNIQFYIDAVIDGVTYSLDALVISSGGVAYWRDNFHLLLKTFPIVIPAGRAVTQWRPRLLIQVGTGGAGPVFKEGMVALFKRELS